MTEKPLFLYRIQPTRLEMLTSGSTAEEAQTISDHFDYLQDLTRRGVAIFVGRTLNTDPSTFGIVVFYADSEGEARQVMEADPAVRRGVMCSELFPFRVSLAGKISPTG